MEEQGGEDMSFKSTPTKVLAWACLAKGSCYLIAKVKRLMVLKLIVFALNMMMLPTHGFVHAHINSKIWSSTHGQDPKFEGHAWLRSGGLAN